MRATHGPIKLSPIYWSIKLRNKNYFRKWSTPWRRCASCCSEKCVFSWNLSKIHENTQRWMRFVLKNSGQFHNNSTIPRSAMPFLGRALLTFGEIEWKLWAKHDGLREVGEMCVPKNWSIKYLEHTFVKFGLECSEKCGFCLNEWMHAFNNLWIGPRIYE